MARVSGKQVVKLQAYCACNNVSRSDAKLPEHQAIMDEALRKVQMYDGLFEGESELSRLDRYDIKIDDSDDPTDLVNYFYGLYPDGFEGVSSRWGVIFTMYNRMKGIDVSKVEETTVGSAVVDTKEETENHSDTKIISKEAKDMANVDEFKKAMDELDQGMDDAVGTDIRTNASVATAMDSEATMDAANEVLQDQENARRDFSNNSKILNGVLPKPNKEAILVDGKNAVGVPLSTKYDAIIDNIRTKAGIVTDTETGVVTATNCKNDEEAKNAVRMLEMMEDLKNGKETAFPVYIGKSAATLKGYLFQFAGESTPKFITHNDFVTLVIEKSLGAIGGTSAAIQAQIKSVTQKNTKKDKTGGSRSAKKSGNAYSGTYSIRWAGKDLLLESALFHQEVVKDEIDEAAQGYKSDACFKYVLKRDANGNPVKYATYRIPLVVKAYKLAVTDTAMKEVFGDVGARAGAPVSAIDINDAKSCAGLMEELAKVFALNASNGNTSETAEAVRRQADVKTEAKTEQQAADVNADFE